MLAPSELSIEALFLGIGTIGNDMLAKKKGSKLLIHMTGYSTTYGMLTIINHSIAQPPSIASEYY